MTRRCPRNFGGLEFFLSPKTQKTTAFIESFCNFFTHKILPQLQCTALRLATQLNRYSDTGYSRPLLFSTKTNSGPGRCSCHQQQTRCLVQLK